MSHHHPEEREIFSTAIEIDDLAKRAVYLNDICEGDLELRARIERLLQLDADASLFLAEDELASSDALSILGSNWNPPEPDSLDRAFEQYEVISMIGTGM